MELKRKKIRTVLIVGTGSLPGGRNNLFLDLHKLDYHKRRLEFKMNFMEEELEEMTRKVTSINKDIENTLAHLDYKPVKVKNGKPSNKLKY